MILNPPKFLSAVLALALLALAIASSLSILAADRPNIVFILADDMGYADISSFGAPDVKTPRIDELAAAGVRFTNIYAVGPECTPSRTAILTGRYPQRVGGMECAIGTGNVGRYDDAIRLAETNDLGLPPEFAVLAPSLKQSGYYNGVFGKWHLGYEPKFSPLLQGFDEFIGFLGGNVEYFRHFELSDLEVYLSGTEPIQREGYLTDLITGDGLAFLEGRAKAPDQPFFLYLPHAAPHFPFQAPGDGDKEPPTAKNWTEGTRETYLEMMRNLDDSVGAVVDALEKHGMTENTLVVFASDHGAMAPGLNTPWRDYKGTLFEGGLRTPVIARWPAKIAPGGLCEQVATLMDFTKSFLVAAGAELPQDSPLDGIDILGHFLGEKPNHLRTLHWRYRRGLDTWRAVLDGAEKYIRRDNAGEIEEWFFDLSEDPYESTNLLEGSPDGPAKARADRLREELRRWEEEVIAAR